MSILDGCFQRKYYVPKMYRRNNRSFLTTPQAKSSLKTNQ